jgi:hypothetical protein
MPYYGLKAYLTVNSAVYNPDIKEAKDLIEKAKMPNRWGNYLGSSSD